MANRRPGVSDDSRSVGWLAEFPNTGRLIEEYSPAYGRDLQLIPNQRAPRWVDELNALN